MEKYITDERTGLQYELVEDYYLIAGEDEPEEEQLSIGIWGQRHLRYIKQHKRIFYTNLLTSGKLNDCLAVSREAEECFFVCQADGRKQGITSSERRQSNAVVTAN